MNKKILFFITILIVIGLISGCVEQDTNGDLPDTKIETSYIDFKVTDRVTEDFSHVNVTFSEIRLFNQTEDENSYIVAISEPTTVDLIALNLSSINTSLGVAEIEAGNYSKLWLNVTACTGRLNATGEEVNISVPSGWLKIQQVHLFNVSKGNHTILIDIDLEDSIHTFHGGEEYKFIPVVGSIEHRYEHKLRFREQNKSKIRTMVGNRKPVIDIVINDALVRNTITLDKNTSYTFNASGTIDLEGDPLTYSWDFGDRNESTGPVVTHVYNEEGRYQLWLTVDDGSDEARYHIVVKVVKQGQGNSNGNS